MSVDGRTGWIRSDLVSANILRLYMNERELVLSRNGNALWSCEFAPGVPGVRSGRYFGVVRGETLLLSWPNRADLRTRLFSGDLSYPTYVRGVKGDFPDGFGRQESMCIGAEAGCALVMSPADMARLLADVPNGVRVEIYTSRDEEREINRPDELSRQIYLGARRQLRYPAAGLGPGSRVPRLTYPGGDIQPDFASSADIVTRAVRQAGLDLQALVHEDVLLFPGRYHGLDMGTDGSGSHRLPPVLAAYMSHNALSLSLDVEADPFGFEAGDIVFFSSQKNGADGAGANVPNLVGVVCETYNPAGLPLVITVRDMGQSTGRVDLLGRATPSVVGHYRMTHLFDYQ